MTPPPGFSTLTPIPGPNANELPPITVSTFTATTPENTPLTHRASTSDNPNPMISHAFVEANYEVLESLLGNDESRYITKTSALNWNTSVMSMMKKGRWNLGLDGSRVKRNSEGGSHSEHIVDDNKSQGKNLPPLLVAHLGMSKNAFHMFTYTLKDSARIWWNSKKVGSIINYEDLKVKFQSHFSQSKKITKKHLAMHNIKQKEGESTRAFVTRYTDDTLQILGLHKEHRISGFIHGLETRSLVEFLSTDLPTTYKGLMEKTYTWIEAREVATNETLNDHREGFDRFKKNSSWDNSKGKRNRSKFSA
ncbi:reverse transcriptase domain-containing protein [Tanacetum coccineum]